MLKVKLSVLFPITQYSIIVEKAFPFLISEQNKSSYPSAVNISFSYCTLLDENQNFFLLVDRFFIFGYTDRL